MLLIGSGMLIECERILGRKPTDRDYICLYDEYSKFVRDNRENILSHYPISGNKQVVKLKDGQIFEFEIAWEGSTAESLLALIQICGYIDPIDLLYTLKMSHRFKKDSPHFNKTRKDVLSLRAEGAKIPECLSDWFKAREKETYNYSHPSLKQDKAGFFNGDGVVYHYDHDQLHECVKLFDKPAYTYFKEDEADVYCSKNLFSALPFNTKLAAVFEESCVLAYERMLIPNQCWDKEKEAFTIALTKVCTSITSGWFREFAWEKYDSVITYWELLEEGWMKKLYDDEILKLPRLADIKKPAQ